MERPGKPLTIGEAAGLVGVTPKAIRHYHEVGLLAEPARSEAGYRMYGAEDLLRLQRIRRLQGLGLSLKQVREVLGAPSGSPTLRAALEALLGEVGTEIERLRERKGRIEALLAKEDLGAPGLLEPPSPTFERIKGFLGERLEEVSPEAVEQDERLFAALDAYSWPEGHAEPYEAMARHFAAHPDEYRRMAALGEGLAALAYAPEDSPEVERLAEEAVRFFGEEQPPEWLPQDAGWPEGPLGEVYSEVMLAELSPAQRRWFALVREKLEEGGAG